MRYFDSRDGELGVKHIMASGALPPAFPAVRIDGELYWDGGILSNTPTEAVFDDNPRKNSLIFAVHLWNPIGRRADHDLARCCNRHKDIQYSSRDRQPHRAPAAVASAAPRHQRARRAVAGGRAQQRGGEGTRPRYGCPTRMHVVRLLAPQLDREDHTKDIDFSPSGIMQRWEAGYRHTKRCSNASPGSASSIRSRASSCTSRWRSCRRRPSEGDVQLAARQA